MENKIIEDIVNGESSITHEMAMSMVRFAKAGIPGGADRLR